MTAAIKPKTKSRPKPGEKVPYRPRHRIRVTRRPHPDNPRCDIFVALVTPAGEPCWRFGAARFCEDSAVEACHGWLSTFRPDGLPVVVEKV